MPAALATRSGCCSSYTALPCALALAAKQPPLLLSLDSPLPRHRYCNYQISRKGGAAPDPAALLALGGGAGGPGLDILQSKLASLAAEAQAQQAAATSSLSWQGEVYPVREEKVRIPIHAAQVRELVYLSVVCCVCQRGRQCGCVRGRGWVPLMGLQQQMLAYRGCRSAGVTRECRSTWSQRGLLAQVRQDD